MSEEPPTAQNFLDFMQFSGKFDEIVCWRPPQGGSAPLLQRILDPPLYVAVKTKLMKRLVFIFKEKIVLIPLIKNHYIIFSLNFTEFTGWTVHVTKGSEICL